MYVCMNQGICLIGWFAYIYIYVCMNQGICLIGWFAYIYMYEPRNMLDRVVCLYMYEPMNTFDWVVCNTIDFKTSSDTFCLSVISSVYLPWKARVKIRKCHKKLGGGSSIIYFFSTNIPESWLLVSNSDFLILIAWQGDGVSTPRND